ncbi:MAG: pyrroloquinoline quinone biosynthesis peptide chaperone PqqD [Neomegalonema sp.]|nr:pyrroloquinoline quinone biosynthesis peptide chaperone PqqD [Neomegalonema sp.]
MSALKDSDVPLLPRGVRLREDAARGGWVLLAPERVLTLDPIAVAVLRELDGERDFAAITAALAAAYAAPQEVIAKDARAFLEDLMDKRMVEVAP